MKTLFLNFRCADRMCIPVLRNITEVSFALSNNALYSVFLV